MALKDQPYIPLYVQDLLTDEKLIECSAEAHGIYFRLLCIMHKSEQYGTILLKQKDKQKNDNYFNFAMKLAKQLPFGLSVIQQGLKELIEEGVLQMDGDLLIQKRMVKDNEISAKRAEAGKKGGSNSLGKKDKFVQAKSKTKRKQNNENEIEDEIENESDIVIEKKLALGEFKNVLLYEHEVKRLHYDFGADYTDLAIKKLSEYGKEKPKPFKAYKDHNLTIRRWVMDAVKDDLNKNKKGLTKIETRNEELTKLSYNLSAAKDNSGGDF